jgi:hypothetical protein
METLVNSRIKRHLVSTKNVDKTGNFLRKAQIGVLVPIIPIIAYFMIRFIESVDTLTETVNLLKIEVSSGRAQQMEKLNTIEVIVNRHEDWIKVIDAQMGLNQVDIELLKVGKRRVGK